MILVVTVRGTLQAFAVPKAPCDACECPDTAIGLQAAAVESVLGLARGPGPWQLVVLRLGEYLRVDLFNATRGNTVLLTTSNKGYVSIHMSLHMPIHMCIDMCIDMC